MKNSLSKFYTQSALVAVSMLALLAIVFYPGYMSPDSISHLEQATGVAHLTDWHPPVITRLWGASDWGNWPHFIDADFSAGTTCYGYVCVVDSRVPAHS